MRVWLTREQARLIVDHAQSTAPHEACGLVGGRGEQALEVIPITNAADNPTTNYFLSPEEQVTAMLQFQRQNLELVAIYHSHPATRPIPSQTDIRQATYPQAAYIIVGLAGDRPQLTAWQIHRGEVTPAELVISDTAPTPSNDPTLTRAGKTAMILSIILATVLLVAYAIALLPPAPPIPTPGG